ncbi:MAG: B12-binding domain-containing radical SAM protein [Candidatus Thorarchaeota archaeon]
MNLLLVNPNKFQNPPVIPVGLEYLKTALEKYNYNVEILDLCFSNTPREDLDKILKKKSFDLVGLTIRNIDSANYYNNQFFLADFKPLVMCVKEHKIPVVLGGSGFSAMPDEILEYLNADYGITGPGEIIFPKFLELWQSNNITQKILDGWEVGVDKQLIYLRGNNFDYPKYLKEEGIVGFRTHIGCSNQCPYCTEANTRVQFGDISNIVEELAHLVNKGYHHFHTCDSEFNTNLKFSRDFCLALVERNLDMKWAVYMKPIPYNEDFFKYLHESKAYLITLTVDSDKRIQTLNKYNYDDLVQIVKFSKKYDIKLAIDLSVGYPNESLKSVKYVIEFLRNHRPFTVGVNSIYRIYNNTSLAALINKNPLLQKNLTKPFKSSEKFLEPIYYNQIPREKLEELISKDDLFKIAGINLGVNYQLI